MGDEFTKCSSVSLIPRPPPFFCSSVRVQYNTRKRKFALFHFRVLYWLNANRRTKNRGGLGTRLWFSVTAAYSLKILSPIRMGQSSCSNVRDIALHPLKYPCYSGFWNRPSFSLQQSTHTCRMVTSFPGPAQASVEAECNVGMRLKDLYFNY